MACVSPPEPSDQTLLTYIDDKATPDIVAHLERCSHCRERAYRLAHLQGRLTHLLYRIECPSPLELGEYHLQVLPAAQMEAIRHHLDQCLHCRREIAQLEGYLAKVAPIPQPGPLEQAVESVRVLVARLVSGGMPGPAAMVPAYASSALASPALAGTRGDESKMPFVYQADDAQVIIEIEADIERPDCKTVLGLVIGPDRVQGFAVHLWQAGQHVTTTSVDELGNFVIPGLLPGKYELILASPELEIHIQNVQVENSKIEPQDGKDP